MASIAYVTDRKMIEFHRAYGNQVMNFWRPSSMKQFSQFNPGDYLFFLAKGTERFNGKEKGIVGYGKYNSAHTMSLRQMWNQYGTYNGYSSKDELAEAITKVNKNHEVGKSIHCLLLTDVVFFQAPVYPSEIGIVIPPNLESYTYLDKFGVDSTVKILQKAQQTGIDAWQSAMDHTLNKDIFKEDVISHILAKQISQVIDPTKPASKILKRFMTTMSESVEYIKGSKQALLKQMPLTVYLPLESNSKNKDQALFELIGKISVLKESLKHESEFEKSDVIYCIISEIKLSAEWLKRLEQIDIQVIEG
jgi:hypothetical protein